jgi:hypothetical protein
LTPFWDGSCTFPLQRNSGIAAVGSRGFWLTKSPSKYSSNLWMFMMFIPQNMVLWVLIHAHLRLKIGA